jgi:hypothetical protein
MNYATDRLDRAGRDRAGIRGLRRDYHDALASGDHVLLARTLCAAGWNRHAVYHYGIALERELTRQEAKSQRDETNGNEDKILLYRLGDYVQMVELAGWPEVSLVALLAFRSYLFRPKNCHNDAETEAPADNGEQQCPDPTVYSLAGLNCRSWESDSDQVNLDNGVVDCDQPAWLDVVPNGDCGCGQGECGRALCHFPEALRPYVPEILHALDDFLAVTSRGWTRLPPMPWSAHAIQRRAVLRSPLDAVHRWNSITLPRTLRIALGMGNAMNGSDNNESDEAKTPNHGALEGVQNPIKIALRMLLVKLLYLTVPMLACAVLAADADETKTTESLSGTSLALGPEYKSHAAFFTFIKSLVLGDRRVKPSRRHSVPYYHLPVWDLFHGIDQRNDYSCPSTPDENACDAASDGNEPLSVCHTIIVRCTDGENELLSLGVPLCGPLLSEQWEKLMEKVTAGVAHHKDQISNGNQPLFPITYYVPRPTGKAPLPPLYVVGDSHVLSLAWQTIQLPLPVHTHRSWVEFVVVPVLVTGLKAWHCQKGARFFTHSRLVDSLRRLQAAGSATIAFSAGEIDCREGLGGPKLAGYATSCLDFIPVTVNRYLSSLLELLENVPTLQQILVLPVAPHVLQSTSRAAGQASRRETIRVWNEELRKRLPSPPSMFFVDYLDHLLVNSSEEASYVLRVDMAADSTHLNAAFARHFEHAIVASGCNLSLLL